MRYRKPPEYRVAAGFFISNQRMPVTDSDFQHKFHRDETFHIDSREIFRSSWRQKRLIRDDAMKRFIDGWRTVVSPEENP
ncbi:MULTISPECIES: hypothetical protein [unclassified Ensifer]|uniref:hypothetical protein n=1 Tax=unclassified Ensifer TaxID=2633371 RepID=UPI00300FE7CB